MKWILILTLLMTIELSLALECFKCSNDVHSDQDRSYCMNDVEQGAVSTETCAEGVTSCFIHDDVGLYSETGEIRTLGVTRGCLPDGMVCDEGGLVTDDVMTYTSCCTDDHCNEAHLVSLPEQS